MYVLFNVCFNVSILALFLLSMEVLSDIRKHASKPAMNHDTVKEQHKYPAYVPVTSTSLAVCVTRNGIQTHACIHFALTRIHTIRIERLACVAKWQRVISRMDQRTKEQRADSISGKA